MIKKLLCVIVVFALLCGCAGSTPAAKSGFAPDEEHRLVVYTSHKQEVWQPIVREFERRTGIWVDVVYGATSELLERIERESRDVQADLMFGGGVESLETYRECFTPYTCAGADRLLTQFRCADGLWTPFSALPVVLIYNTKLMEPGLLTGWRDLLAPELQGEIAFTDPSVSGSAFTALMTMLCALPGDRGENLRAFAENLGGVQLDGSGAVLTAVADGSATVGVTLEETALKRIAEGENIAMVYPADGTSCVPDASAIVRGAPHEENARAFIDFTVSAEVQRLLSSQFCRRPVLEGVDSLPGSPALDELPAADYDLELAVSERDAVLMSWAFYLVKSEA